MERAREATPARQSTGDEESRPRAARQPSASLTQYIRSAAPSPPGAEIPPATRGGDALGSERGGYGEEQGEVASGERRRYRCWMAWAHRPRRGGYSGGGGGKVVRGGGEEGG